MQFLVHCLISIGIFSHVAFASNSTIYTTPAPNALNNTECVRKCIHQLLQNSLQRDYHHCMGECVGDWPLQYVGGCQDVSPLIQPMGPASCPPYREDIWYDEELITDKVTNETVGYLTVSWKPCPAGIQDLTGFYVELQRYASFEINCQLVALTRKLTTQETDTRFTVVFLPKLINSARYVSRLRSLPMVDDNKIKEHIRTLACNVLNTDPCHCAPHPKPPKVNVSGYTVEITTPPALKCHQIEGYDFIIRTKKPLKDWKSKPVFEVSDDEHVINTTFHRMYDSIGGFEASVVLVLANDEIRSQPTGFVVEAWTPPKPNATKVGTIIEVSFESASPDYGISTYHLCLSKHIGSSEDESKKVEVVSVNELKADPNEFKVISYPFSSLESGGLYSVKVREEREETSIFKSAEWGESRLFNAPVVLHPALIPGIVIPLSVAFCLLVILMLVCLWRKEKCLKVLYFLPTSVINALKPRIISLRRRTVLIVWQADIRSKKLGELHAFNVRFFAAFLSNQCGFRVILDAFEENLISHSIDEWTLHACERADFVIFICPHFDEQSMSSEIPPLLGDFQFMFRFLRNELRTNQRRRLITVRFPYSDPACSSSSKILVQTTRVFKIMDSIRSLYFHIQGVPRSELAGDNTVELINSSDYVKTNEGAGLRDGIIAFQAAYSKWMATSADSDCPPEEIERNMEAGEIDVPCFSFSTVDCGEFLPVQDDPQIYRLELAPFSTDHHSESGEEVMEDCLVGHPISDSPLRQQRPPLNPPPPLLVSNIDVMDEINAINNLQGHLLEDQNLDVGRYRLPPIPPLENLRDPELPLCPYDDVPSGSFLPVETIQPLFDASLGQHSSVYGVDSTSFHDSGLQDPGETSPKSPVGEPNFQRRDSMEVQVLNPRRDSSSSEGDIAMTSDSGFDSHIV